MHSQYTYWLFFGRWENCRTQRNPAWTQKVHALKLCHHMPPKLHWTWCLIDSHTDNNSFLSFHLCTAMNRRLCDWSYAHCLSYYLREKKNISSKKAFLGYTVKKKVYIYEENGLASETSIIKSSDKYFFFVILTIVVIWWIIFSFLKLIFVWKMHRQLILFTALLRKSFPSVWLSLLPHALWSRG